MADFLYDSTERMDTSPRPHRVIGVTVSPALGSGGEMMAKVTRIGVTLIEKVHGGFVPLHLVDMDVKEQTRGVLENLDQVIAHLQLQRIRLADEMGRLESGGAEELLEEIERHVSQIKAGE